MKTHDKRPRRDKRRCVHFVGSEEGLSEDYCGISDGNIHWWGKCGGAHGCPNFKESDAPVMQGDGKKGGEP